MTVGAAGDYAWEPGFDNAGRLVEVSLVGRVANSTIECAGCALRRTDPSSNAVCTCCDLTGSAALPGDTTG